MMLDTLSDEQAVLGPGGAAPVRKLNSVRRTLTIDTVFPEGMDGVQHMSGVCRDLVTGGDLTEVQVPSLDQISITASRDRVILSADAGPERADEMKSLIGLRAGGQLRGANAQINPDMKTGGSAFHLLLDDLAVATLVAGWVWIEWDGSDVPGYGLVDHKTRSKFVMENACHGFKTGSSSLTPEGFPRDDNQFHRRVPSIVHPDDPLGWHAFTEPSVLSSRRARWVDVWRQDERRIAVHAGFQDSGLLPDGTRGAVHEYLVDVIADAETLEIIDISAEPRILPYLECPAVAARVEALKGKRIPDLRTDVVRAFKGTNGCTHLNDVLRGLADVSVLVKQLPG